MTNLHTYLDGIVPFIYMGLWAMRASHSTATLSPGGTRGLYELRFMHRLNIFLSRFGPRAGRASFLSRRSPNPNPILTVQGKYTECRFMSFVIPAICDVSMVFSYTLRDSEVNGLYFYINDLNRGLPSD
jgi:hypothetical protein